MGSLTLDPVIQTMVDRPARGFHPQRIILFGSHARGTAQPTSDVDLLVILREVADKRRAAVEMRRAFWRRRGLGNLMAGDLQFHEPL